MRLTDRRVTLTAGPVKRIKFSAASLKKVVARKLPSKLCFSVTDVDVATSGESNAWSDSTMNSATGTDSISARAGSDSESPTACDLTPTFKRTEKFYNHNLLDARFSQKS